VAALAKAIEGDLPPEGRLLLVGVLKGAAFLLADLAREISLPVRIDFVRLRSYGSGTRSRGEPETLVEPDADPAGMDVVVVEDVVDTGRSLAKLRELFEGRGARSVRLLALVDKAGRREREVTLDYTGFRRGDGFLVGYGMDHAEEYRHLPGIWLLPEGSPGIDPDGQAGTIPGGEAKGPTADGGNE
jgi:hypoxanthine phosphoribosyltransferase